MALLTTQNISRAANSPSFAAVAASDTFLPGARVFVHVINGGGSSDNVTFTCVGDPAGFTIVDLVVAVPNGQERIIGPFPSQFFADPTTGLATMAHSFTTSVTVGVFKLAET